MTDCAIEECTGLVGAKGARGWCPKHYKRWKRNGDPLVLVVGRGLTVAERFARGVSVRGAGKCWPWTLGTDKDGYGAIDHLRAHRVAYELANGPIPPGLIVMHSCDNPPCCNAEHLTAGTDADNAADRVAKGRSGSRSRAYCHNGHQLDESNTRQEGRCRRCLPCKAAYDRARHAEATA